jgi:hypothetical protein
MPNILYVDCEEGKARTRVGHLEDAGFKCTPVYTVEEALMRLEREEYDGVFLGKLSINPGWSREDSPSESTYESIYNGGFSIIARAIEKNLAVIVTTGASTEEILHARALGANVLEEPIVWQKYIELAQRLFEKAPETRETS